MIRILIAEDEIAIAELVEMTLVEAGYECIIAQDGKQAADLLETASFDLALLDVMMPEIDGFELIEYSKPLNVPVIFLTAKSTVQNRIKGLQLGADDYIIKPFHTGELIARVETVLRRTGKGGTVHSVFGLTIDFASQKVMRGDMEVKLLPKEFTLLEVFVRNRGVALYRDTLFERAWGGEIGDGSRSLDINVLRLRQKLGISKEHLRTVRTVGYMLEKE